MEMCYEGALSLPSSYAVMKEEEMTYVEAGGLATVRSTALDIRNRLTRVIGLSLVGTGTGVALGGLIGGIPGAVVGGLVGNAYYASFRSCASSAHSKVEAIIRKYGKNQKCEMNTTYSFAFYCTGISVKTM